MKKLIALLCLAVASNLIAQEHSNIDSPFAKNLTRAYIAMQTSLANDDLTAAQEAALFYVSAFEQSNAGLNTEHFTQSANEISSTNDISIARTAFKELSSQAKMLFDYLAPSSESPLHVAHCSMAFNGEGAIWIQDSTEIANPYYGASMLRCGEIKRTFGAKGKAASSPVDSCPTGATSSPSKSEAHDACCEH